MTHDKTKSDPQGMHIRVNEVDAWVHLGVWTCADERTLQYLRLIHQEQYPHGYGPQHPSPDYDAARWAASALGGQVISEKPQVEYHEGRIY